MEAEQILAQMKAFFAEKQPPVPPEALENFAGQSPRTLLTESLDVVDFVVYLEDELGREIDVSQLGEALLNKNFGDLAHEVARMMAEG